MNVEAINAITREQARIRGAVVRIPSYNGHISRAEVLRILNPNDAVTVSEKFVVEKELLGVLASEPLSILSDHTARVANARAQHIDKTAMRVWGVPKFIIKRRNLLKLWARYNRLAIEMQRAHAEPVTIYRFKKRGVVVGMTRISDI